MKWTVLHQHQCQMKACAEGQSSLHQAHSMSFECPNACAGQTRHIQGLQLDELAGWKFWRFNLEAVLGDEPRTLEYSITADQIDKSARQAQNT